MLQRQFVLAHLGENRANVQVDVAGVRDLQALINGLLREVQIVVLDLQGFLQVGESTTQLLCAAEDASKVIVCNGAVPIALLCQTHRLVKQLE